MSRKEGKKNMRTRVDSRFLIATIDGELQIIDRGVLVYEGDTVVFVGPDYTEPCDRTIDASNRIVSPGFISAHTHMGVAPSTDRSARMFTIIGKRGSTKCSCQFEQRRTLTQPEQRHGPPCWS